MQRGFALSCTKEVEKMDKIILTNEWALKKVDSTSEADISFLSILEKEEGVLEYLYELHSLKNSSCRNELWGTSFLIYEKEEPIGFLWISNLFRTNTKCFVTLDYALLEKYRNKGFMHQVLLEVCTLLFQDQVQCIDEIDLCIAWENKKAQNLAKSCHFIEDGLTKKEHERQGYVKYYKRRKS